MIVVVYSIDYCFRNVSSFFPNTFFHVETERLSLWRFAGWFLMVIFLIETCHTNRIQSLFFLFVCRGVQCAIFVEWPAFPHVFLRVFADWTAPETVFSSDTLKQPEIFPQTIFEIWDAPSKLQHMFNFAQVYDTLGRALTCTDIWRNKCTITAGSGLFIVVYCVICFARSCEQMTFGIEVLRC